MKDESFGIIPLAKHQGQWSVFLIQHRKAGYWGFPKGHAEPGETAQEAAQRELKEETHLDVIRLIQEAPLVENYRFYKAGKLIDKQVHYFIAEVAGHVQLQRHEVADGLWVPISKALHHLTHKEAKEILSSAIKILKHVL